MAHPDGILIGLATFIVIGSFHPLVIKGEYHFGTRIWWAFFIAGLIFSSISLFSDNFYIRIICGVVAFSSFWGIFEVFEQRKRVRKGWFPKNPHRQNDYD